MQTMRWNMPKPSHCKPAIDTLIVSFIWLQQRMGEREKNQIMMATTRLSSCRLVAAKKNEKSSVNRAMIKSKSVSYSTFSSIPRRPRHALDATVYANCYLMLTLAPNSTELNDNGGVLVESWGSAFQLIEIMSPPTHTHTQDRHRTWWRVWKCTPCGLQPKPAKPSPVSLLTPGGRWSIIDGCAVRDYGRGHHYHRHRCHGEFHWFCFFTNYTGPRPRRLPHTHTYTKHSNQIRMRARCRWKRFWTMRRRRLGNGLWFGLAGGRYVLHTGSRRLLLWMQRRIKRFRWG